MRIGMSWVNVGTLRPDYRAGPGTVDGMGLTGGVLGWLVVVLTVAGFAGVVWAWPAVAGRSVGRIAARAGMLLGVNLLVLLTAAVQLNDQFLFFADWADLRGALGGPPATSALHSGGG